MIKTVHPFPARMAPGLALDSLESLAVGSVVLDPMSGSGTVLRQALDLGHTAIGFDVDPLAVLMSRVWTRPVDDDAIGRVYESLLELAAKKVGPPCQPSWQDDKETAEFVRYWFAPSQADGLRRISFALDAIGKTTLTSEDAAALDVLRLNLSRIIVTKEQAASLARDTSHSRPHRVSIESQYDVFVGFDKALKVLRTRLKADPLTHAAQVSSGDARNLSDIKDESIDVVVTSPPYLNAIDYLRGHRLSLIWLGWRLSELRLIRGNSIGTERSPDDAIDRSTELIVEAMIGESTLPPRHLGMIKRYAADIQQMVAEIARVLKAEGRATFVVGNSCLKGIFVRNADGVAEAAKFAGLVEIARSERELPAGSRYLPVSGVALEKRMRTETVLSFAR